MTRSGVLTYDGLPIARGGAHRLPTRGFEAGRLALAKFVDQIAQGTDPAELSVEVLMPVAGADAHWRELMAWLDASYPRLRVRSVGADYRGYQFEIPPAAMRSIVNDLERAGPFPDTVYAGPSVVVQAKWRLLLLDPKSRLPLAHQNAEDYLGFAIDADRRLGSSMLHARIASVTTANLFLSLPFEAPTEDARRLAAAIQSAFPARISSGHWKHWTLTKTGNSYVGRKVAILA